MNISKKYQSSVVPNRATLLLESGELVRFIHKGGKTLFFYQTFPFNEKSSQRKVDTSYKRSNGSFFSICYIHPNHSIWMLLVKDNRPMRRFPVSNVTTSSGKQRLAVRKS